MTNPNQIVSARMGDLAQAVMALMFFIEHRIQEGMPLDELLPFMDAYLNLWADLKGQAHPDPSALRLHVAAVPPSRERSMSGAGYPSWIPRGG